MASKPKTKWLETSEDKDYPAAEFYLSLIYDSENAAKLVRKFKKSSVSEFQAKDIFRASGLSLLGVSNSHVEKDRAKILARQAQSPLLLVRYPANGKVVIADGYHRLCSIYKFGEDAVIPCKIVDGP